jgi:hypothetical protein
LSTRFCWRARSLVALLLLAAVSSPSFVMAQEKSTEAQRAAQDTGVPGRPNRIGKDLLLNIVDDQKAIWTSPARLRFKDLKWIVPLGGLTAGLIAFDSDISRNAAEHANWISPAKKFSDYGLYGAIAGSGMLYVAGRWHQNEHLRETGLLAGEAVINTYAVTSVLKPVFRRPRPYQDDGNGQFFTGGYSFPSEHATASWAIASVVAHEYPGTLTKVTMYSAATAISVARVLAQQHFSSDVLVGSAIGWLVGRQVYRAHHDRDLPGDSYGTFEPAEETQRQPGDIGSPYVPVGSWVYGVFDRLMAAGVVESQIAGLRPWTRIECARLLEPATELDPEDFTDPWFKNAVESLQKEFAPEIQQMATGKNRYAKVDDVYVLARGIGGDPLSDSYHFAPTIENDNGRPYAAGFNSYSGATASAAIGPFAFFANGEIQQSPAATPYSKSVQDAIQLADFKPIQPVPGTSSIVRARLQEAYVSYTTHSFQFSFGRRTLWWGPGSDAMLMSNNAGPIPMASLDQTTPVELPGLLKFLGSLRTQFFFGRLDGQQFVNTEGGAIFDRATATWVGTLGQSLSNQPFIHGEKVSFRPTSNFEFSISRTGIFGGPGFPVTFGRFKHVMFSASSGYNSATDPGDRRSGFDFSYRLPKLRNRATLYADMFTDDEISPIGYPRQSAFTTGLYLPQIPRLSKLDLRLEGGLTDVVGVGQPFGTGFFYWNIRYVDGYTNDGQILGSPMSRRGKRYKASAKYWSSAHTSYSMTYTKDQANGKFLGGGSSDKVTFDASSRLKSNFDVNLQLQYGTWHYPLLAASNKNNFTSSLEVKYVFPVRSK